MSDNRFQNCHTAGEVLWRFRAAVAESILNIVDQRKRYELTTDALARIAELTPRTVTTEQRERVRKLVSGWVDGMQCHAVTDRIIEALGYTDASHQCADTPAAPATPAVGLDLTALDHIRGVLARYDNLRAAMVDQPMFGDMPDITIPGDLPMRITMDDNGVSVLRIGGCDE